MQKQRIPYLDLAQLKDEKMLAEFDRCRRDGTPRPESQAIRGHVPATFWAFANTWDAVFRNGVLDHAIKELCRVYAARAINCDYCANQRSVKSAQVGLDEADYKDLMNFEKSSRYDDRQKTALAYAEAIVWDLPTDDALWDRLYKHFTIPQIVELGFFMAITMGQGRWLRTLNIEHHQVLAGTSGAMAPGFENMDALKKSKSDPDYWANLQNRPKVEAAE
jgi:alkylhydroperoxidase family enzyme